MANNELYDPAGEVGPALSGLWRLLGTTEDLTEVLQRLADVAVRIFPPGVDASITVVADDEGMRPQTVATTNPDVLPMDAAQYDADSGPCLDAARTRTPIRTHLHEAKQRWPEFAAAAEDAGVMTYLSAPLITEHGVIGSFNLYSQKENGFAEADAALLTLFTNSALAAVAVADQRRQAAEMAEGLRTAMQSRSTIDQAIGILRERHHLTAAEAWTKLQRESQNRNIKVRDLAATITQQPATQPPPHDEGR